MAKMKENLSDIFSGVNKELFNSTKEKFNKLSSVEKKKVLDSTNKLMDAFYDICGVENKYHLTEEMFDDAKEKCKETAENIKDSIKESKDNLAEIARDTLTKLGISDEFIKSCKVDNDKIYIDVQMPVDSYINDIDIDLNIDNDGVSYDQQAEEPHNVPKFTRKNKVKNKKVRLSNKIKFRDNHPVVDAEQIADDTQCSVKTTNILDRLKAEAKEKAKEKAEEKATSKIASSQYDKDARVRTGAYRIIGVAQTVTVGAGQTLEQISTRYLGSGMECYVEALNGTSTVKAGQKIKIPKLELKKKKK